MRAQYCPLATVSMQLNGRNSNTISKTTDSCHSKEYTENNINLTYLTLSRPGVSHTARENMCAVTDLPQTAKILTEILSTTQATPICVAYFLSVNYRCKHLRV